MLVVESLRISGIEKLEGGGETRKEKHTWVGRQVGFNVLLVSRGVLVVGEGLWLLVPFHRGRRLRRGGVRVEVGRPL